MSRQAHALLALTRYASGAVTAHRAVGYDGAQATVAGQKVFGVSQTDAVSGEAFAATTHGTAVIETGGAFTVGTAITVDAQGRAVAATAAAATVAAGATAVTSSAANGAIVALAGGYLPQFILGDALQAANGAGEFIEIKLR